MLDQRTGCAANRRKLVKPDIHPEYRTIAFEDALTGERRR